eukprot:scaffold43275_cov67-Cyclotella_meneghiniana.AAC.4
MEQLLQYILVQEWRALLNTLPIIIVTFAIDCWGETIPINLLVFVLKLDVDKIPHGKIGCPYISTTPSPQTKTFVAVTSGITGLVNATKGLKKVHQNAIDNSLKLALSVLNEAASVQTELWSWCASLCGINGTMVLVVNNIPGANTLG